MVFGSDICANDNETGELAEDLLSIVTVFVARHNGLRSAANRKRRKETSQAIQKFQEGSNETSSRQARWTYNRCLIAVEKEGVEQKKKDLRARCLNAENFQNKTEFKWVLEPPYDIRDEAMNDLLKGYTSNFAAKRKNFKMKFRSKKDPQQSIAILSKHWGKSHAESLPKQLDYDSRLVINRLDEFYLCIPEPLKIRAENQGPLFSENQEKGGSGVIVLDPGVRTFMTSYDPSGMAIEWGKNDINRIYRLCHVYGRLQSKRDMIHGKGKTLQTTACYVAYSQEDLLSKFRTQRMIRRGQRRIGSKTARAMCTWPHLAHKAREHPWCQIIICTEEYTSKTCGFCGYVYRKLGGSKVFRCPECKTELDRDINGARNILLRYLTKKESV
ncbi:14009_t:CDS:2 [Gigaspora margarita]|uniref:14009_t:CDS:1 n=1 Tax=Gigaspora margarita TaxID=4874 RepID=A0ABN7UMF6_GIGMA|nr:14009_t:CDS:2 [Gigaspora margarita]